MIATGELADVFVEAADSLVDDFDLVDFLQNLTDRAAAISGASSVGLLLADHRDTLRFMAASTASGQVLELFQLQNDDGPCLDCFRTGLPVVNADLRHAADRWPRFAPRAVAAGFESVHAFPMRLRKKVIGAMNLFGAVDDHFDPEEVRLVQALADIATIALLQERSIAHAGVVTQQLQAALNSRVAVEQAKGAVAQKLGTSPDEAFQLLRARARSTGRSISEVAAEVLHGA